MINVNLRGGLGGMHLVAFFHGEKRFLEQRESRALRVLPPSRIAIVPDTFTLDAACSCALSSSPRRFILGIYARLFMHKPATAAATAATAAAGHRLKEFV